MNQLRKDLEAATGGPWAVPVANVFRVLAPGEPHSNPAEGKAPPYPWRIVADLIGPDANAADAVAIAHLRNLAAPMLDVVQAALVVQEIADGGDFDSRRGDLAYALNRFQEAYEREYPEPPPRS